MSCADRGETYEEEAAEVIERLRQLTRDIEPPPQLLSVVLAQGEPLGSPRRGWWATVRTQSECYGEMLRCTPPLIRWTIVTQSALLATREDGLTGRWTRCARTLGYVWRKYCRPAKWDAWSAGSATQVMLR